MCSTIRGCRPAERGREPGRLMLEIEGATGQHFPARHQDYGAVRETLRAVVFYEHRFVDARAPLGEHDRRRVLDVRARREKHAPSAGSGEREDVNGGDGDERERKREVQRFRATRRRLVLSDKFRKNLLRILLQLIQKLLQICSKDALRDLRLHPS